MLAGAVLLGLGTAACGGSSGHKSAGSAGTAPTDPATAGRSSSSGAASSSTTAPPGTSGTTSTAPTKEVSPAGDIPDTQVFVTYRPTGQGFSVKVPEGWSRTTRGAVTMFTDKLNTVEMQRMDQPQPPTATTVKNVDMPKLAKSEKHFQPGSVTSVRRAAGSAVLLTYQADGSPDAVTAKVRRLAVERYTFWRNGRAVILTLSGPEGADNVDPWKTVTNSFSWQP